jgi:hypothetical protein
VCQFRILGEAPIILTRLYPVLNHSVQENTETTSLPQITPRPLPFTPVPMNYSYHSPLHTILCSTVLPEELTVAQLHHKFLALYGNRRFITAFAKTSHLSPSCSTSVQYTFCQLDYLKSTLILPFHVSLGLPSCLVSSGFPHQNHVRTSFPLYALPRK